MVENRENIHSSINLLVGIAALIGLVLVVVGALALLHAIYTVWQLYSSPDRIISFAQTFKLTTASLVNLDVNGLDLLRLITWPFVILVLLLQGKVGVWAIEAGARLLGTARNK